MSVARAIRSLGRRGLVADVTTTGAELDAALAASASRSGTPLSVYAGFDPTGPSLHLGHLAVLLALRRLQHAGLRPILLVGGATALIGDPTGRRTDRPLLDEEVVARNAANIQRSVAGLFSADNDEVAQYDDEEEADGETEANEPGRQPLHSILRRAGPLPQPLLVDNASFYRDMNVLAFLRDVGRHARLNAMLAKESVAARLPSAASKEKDKDEGSAGPGAAVAGLSYAEFSYQLLQANDYCRLHGEQNCALQIGGSDQWGNITAGIELIRRRQASTTPDSTPTSVEPQGMTVPLLTTSTGEKFGKSSTSGGTAVWLDASLTRHHALYQHLLNSGDADVEKYLRLVTTLGSATIKQVMEEHSRAPQLRKAQIALADAVTGLVRGQEAVATARRCAAILFAGTAAWSSASAGAAGGASMRGEDLMELGEGGDLPCLRLSQAEASSPTLQLAEVLVRLGLVKSKTEARKLIGAGAVAVNGVKLSPAAIADNETEASSKQPGNVAFSSVVLGRGLMLGASSGHQHATSSDHKGKAACLLGVGRDKKAIVLLQP